MTRLALALIAAFSASPVWAQAPISQPLFHGSAHDCDDPNFSGHLPSGFVCRGTGTGSGIRAKTNDNHVVIYNIAPSINSTEGLCYLDLFPVGRYEMKQTLQYLRCKGAMPDCSIAEGQAGNQADQFGVAATIQNRLDQGFAGSSSGAYGIATQAGQFSAFPNRLVTPTPYTDALAGALLNGNLSDFGSTGNATYYNATGYAYPNLGLNSFGSGSNAYSDQFNGPGGQPIGTPPTSNFNFRSGTARQRQRRPPATARAKAKLSTQAPAYSPAASARPEHSQEQRLPEFRHRAAATFTISARRPRPVAAALETAFPCRATKRRFRTI